MLRIQPQGATNLNRGGPLGGTVRAGFAHAATAFDYARRTFLTPGASASFAINSPAGWMQEFSGSATAGTQLAGGSGLSALVNAVNPVWIVMQVRIKSLGTRRVLLSDFSSGGNSASFRFEQQAANTWIFGCASGGVFQDASGGTVTTGIHTVAMWHGTDLKTRLIVDGGATLVSASPTSSTRDSGTDLRLGSAGAYVSLPFDGGVGAFFIGEGEPGEPAMRALCENPWQLFSAPQPRRYWLASPASAYPVLSAATVTAITSTGATPRVTITI